MTVHTQGHNIALPREQVPNDDYPAVIEVMKLVEENKRMRLTLAAQSAMISQLQGELASAMRAAPGEWSGWGAEGIAP